VTDGTTEVTTNVFASIVLTDDEPQAVKRHEFDRRGCGERLRQRARE
jgi:hypothetical protein